jgi:hypothetical protein
VVELLRPRYAVFGDFEVENEVLRLNVDDLVAVVVVVEACAESPRNEGYPLLVFGRVEVVGVLLPPNMLAPFHRPPFELEEEAVE